MINPRRWLGLVALTVALAQGAAVTAAAVVYARSGQADDESVDCCLPGSHAPGMCPLHRKAAPSTSSATCRLSCAMTLSPPVTLMMAAPLGAPVSIASPASIGLELPINSGSPFETDSTPLSPPPRG